MCVYYDRWPAGYAYRVDGKLSAGLLDTWGAGTVELHSIFIDGANIKVTFRNTSSLYLSRITVYVTADVWNPQ